MHFSIRSLSIFSLMLICSSCARLTPPAYFKALLVDPSTPRQVLAVTPSNKVPFKATLTAWAYKNRNWHRCFGPWPVAVGRNGFAPINEKKEGDGRTPSGTYPIGLAFGKASQINTGLTYRQTRANDLWVDDVNSTQYNQWVSAPTQATSFENMLRPDGLYDIGAVIEYNTSPVIPGNGSAIFIHIWRDHGLKPTAGCVALNQRNLRQLLAWLRADLKPVIILNKPSP